MATTTDLGNVNIFSSLASFNSNKANLKSNDLNFIKQTAAEMAVVGGGIVAQLLAENGYIKFANGLILQWGTWPSGDTNPHVFPISFSKQCYQIVCAINVDSDANMDKRRVYVSSLTTTGFDIKRLGDGIRMIAVGA